MASDWQNNRHAVPNEPMPPAESGADIITLVAQDLESRRAYGISKYGTTLQAHNGRNALIDAYQEALDLAVYLRQAIEEQENGHQINAPRHSGWTRILDKMSSLWRQR